VDWGIRSFGFVAPCGWVMCLRRYEKPYRLYSPGYELIYGLITVKMEAVHSCEPSGSSYGTTVESDCFFNTNTGLQLKRYFSGGSFPEVKWQPPLCTNRIFRWSIRSLSLSLSLSRSLVTQVTRRLAVINIALLSYCVAVAVDVVHKRLKMSSI
jgi:hypothetical protein